MKLVDSDPAANALAWVALTCYSLSVLLGLVRLAMLLER